MIHDQGQLAAWQMAKARVAALRKNGADTSIGADRVDRFRHEEDGGATILTLFIFLFMLVMAGLGIDLMRYEMERTHLQSTLDSAVLAGAGAPEGTDKEGIKAIVEDYFAKNNMSDYLHAIDTEGDDDIATSLNATKVYAEASMNINTYLMKLSGVDTLSAAGAAQAEVRVPKLEVSLILDVSGSMQGEKLSDLQTAAKKFVTTMLDNSDPGNTVISVIPFAWNVTPGEDIYSALTVNETHDYSSCLRFYDSDYGEPSIDPNVAYDQQIYTSVYGSFDNHNDAWRSCYPEDNAQILPYSMDETALHNHIDALHADGNTSAHIGMKWGAAMLDSKFENLVTDLQATGVVDASLSNLPAVYGEEATLKIAVLMADGMNTTSYYFDNDSPYRGPNSDLFRLTFTEMKFDYGYYVWNVGQRYYDSSYESRCSSNWFECVYEPSDDVTSAYYLRNGSYFYDIENRDWLSGTEMQEIRDSDGFISEEQLDWEEAWGLMSPEYYRNITGNYGPWYDYVGSEYEDGSTKDSRMQAICSSTKSQGVVVYTIGYDIAAGGNAERQLEDCASSGNHYYPTDGANISAAFNSIASNVQTLRLTQ